MASVKIPLPTAQITALATSLRRLSAKLPLVYLLILLIILFETLYIVLRPIDDRIQSQAKAAYPPAAIDFDQSKLDELDSLSSPPTVPSPGGRGNPFLP